MLPPRRSKKTCRPPKLPRQAVVIFILRGHEEFGSTMIGVLERYAKTIQDNQGKVMLAGISQNVVTQLDNIGMLDIIGRENVFLAEKQWGAAGNKAYEAAQAWLAAVEQAQKPEQEKK